MKKHYILDCPHEYNFIVLAINSHSKAYKLCWNLNKTLNLNFEINEQHKIKSGLLFNRYTSKKEEGLICNLLLNRSTKGYMIPEQKSVNYFLIISTKNWESIKYNFLSKLRSINDILLVFEIDLEKIKNSNRFIIHDKKN